MADNYLEKRYEETLGANKPKVKRIGHTVDELLLKNRSVRGYKKVYTVSREELERMAAIMRREHLSIARSCAKLSTCPIRR